MITREELLNKIGHHDRLITEFNNDLITIKGALELNRKWRDFYQEALDAMEAADDN